MTATRASFPSDQHETQRATTRFVDQLARRLLYRRLAKMHIGKLTLVCAGDKVEFGSADSEDCLAATIYINDSRFYGNVVFAGALGAAESYIEGDWTTDNLTGVVQLLLRNREVLDEMDQGSSRIAALPRKLLHWLNRNTRSGSRRNISSHYDLGNDFFSLWLDPRMMYSSAIFEHAEMSLDEAATAKLDRICRKLELSPSDHVLEIGTGWGGFAIYAAETYGCRVTTTTISKEQFIHASRLVSDRGLDDRITLLHQDYRDLTGTYDKLVSIEMIEAVGHDFLNTYFNSCSSLLKCDGMMLLQAITIADQRYKTALNSVDFIQRYIFPGGFLPSVTAMLNSITGSSDMRLYHLEDIGPHYATTLKKWREKFISRLPMVQSMGYSEEFVRMWHYYFCYCEGGFIERAIGDVQMLLVKPGCRRSPLVPKLS